MNLLTIQFTFAILDEIIPFIRYLPKLQTIVVFRLKKHYFDDHKDTAIILKTEKLNEERLKLSNARKITIFVEEMVYLKVKWAKNRTK